MRALPVLLALWPGLLLAQPKKAPDVPTEEELEMVQLLELLEGLDEADLDLLLPAPAPAPARDGGT